MFVNSILNPSALDVFAVAMVVIIAITGGVVGLEAVLEAQNKIAWTEMFIPYNNITTIDADEFENNFPYTFDDPLRQFLHVFQNPSNEPSPVFIYAHSSNNTAKSLLSQIDDVAAAGYSVISWESVSLLNPGSKTALTDFETCVSDFELVWSWFHANAKFYNFDTESVILGGRSRGSLCSWSMAHSQKPGIRGIYMSDAFPDGAWKKDAEISEGYYVWEELVTVNSPPAFLVFGPECPKPITQDCVASPEPSNIHNPRHGQTIVDRYTKLGIGKRITLMDGFENKGNGVYDFFRDFVATLSTSDPIRSNSTVDCTDNPTKKFEIEIDGDIKTKDCPWLASKKKSERKDYCKKKIKVNGNDKKTNQDLQGNLRPGRIWAMRELAAWSGCTSNCNTKGIRRDTT